jgi:uncharacterized protein (DUF58 family)
VLAFSAIRNNDKVGLLLFSDEVEKFMPPRKGRRHVLRVIREILFYEPRRKGTNLNAALQFLSRVLSHKSIAVVISDFLDENAVATHARRPGAGPASAGQSLMSQGCYAALRQVNRRHDLVAVQITDRHELELPPVGRILLEDSETGRLVEVNTSVRRHREAFRERQLRAQGELARMLRSANIDNIQLRTGQPYAAALGRFFEAREKRRLR